VDEPGRTMFSILQRKRLRIADFASKADLVTH